MNRLKGYRVVVAGLRPAGFALLALMLSACEVLQDSGDPVGRDHAPSAKREAVEVLPDGGRRIALQGWPELAALDWTAQGLRVDARAARGDDLVGITGAFCAIAPSRPAARRGPGD